MGGEGINSALMDGADIAWKLALVLRSAAKPSLLETYAIERKLADHHALQVINEIHKTIMPLVEKCRAGEVPCLPAQDPAEALAGLRARLMLDVSYNRSLLIHAGAGDTQPAPGARFPGCAISTERPTTSSFLATRRGSTISKRDGAAS
jgi:FAD binding domain